MPSVIYGSATKPPKTLFVANSLLYCEVFGAVALTVLAREPMLTVICAVASLAFLHRIDQQGTAYQQHLAQRVLAFVRNRRL